MHTVGFIVEVETARSFFPAGERVALEFQTFAGTPSKHNQSYALCNCLTYLN